MPTHPPTDDEPSGDDGGDDPRRLDAFDDLAERCRGGEPVDEAAIRRDYPEAAEALIRSLPALRLLAGLAPPAGGAGGAGGPPSALPIREEFEVVRRIGRGGMGVVYEAVQGSTNRRVALKFLPPEVALDERHRKRLLREATAASLLDHEHIVPVIAINITGSSPYYAMKFIEGHSLAEVLRVLRRRAGLDRDDGPPPDFPPSLEDLAARLEADGFAPGRTPPAGPAAPRRPARPDFDAVARLGIQAADALDHAHAGGVTHRDVKPANLLLDPRGYLWLADFGLAVLKDRDATRADGPAGGTVGYMSPEQAAPENPPCDHRTDIFSLGATLYELATLHRPPPILGTQPGAEVRPPRRLAASIPRDLETIILKAMEAEPARRYASAGEMARDLGRFLRREPIRARPASPADHVARWARRHRLALAAWGATVATLLVALVALLAVANRREAAERRRAESNVEALRGLVREATLAAEALTQAVPPGSDHLHEYYVRMRAFHEQALARIPGAAGDHEAHYRAALANHHLGRSFEAREAPPKAETLRCYGRAIDLLAALVRTHPEKEWYRYNLFRSLSSRSAVTISLTDPGRFARAEADARESLRVAEGLARDFPGNPDWEDAVACQHFMLAQALLERGDPGEVDSHLDSALAIATRLSRAHPEKPFYLNNVVRAWTMRSALMRRLGRTGEAESSIREAIRVHEQVSRSGPDQANYPFERVELIRTLGGILQGSRRAQDALPFLEEARSLVDRLHRAYPYRVDYLESAMKVRSQLAEVHRFAGRDAEADALSRDATRLIEEAAAAKPDDRRIHALRKGPALGPAPDAPRADRTGR